MDSIIFIILLLASLVYNMIQYKKLKSCDCNNTPKKKSAYKKSWENGGKRKPKFKSKSHL